ncbi:hypothetical protein [Hydrogenophaga sp. SL48]|uniref:hypothetical protein n=1 Tax=Hydrogenophaga sp. SL48 TaxID=2806347 RepID=UPI001F3CE2D1|nr:hypothetical protein [Hydrogenophaga sp. SL48]UJW79038.1 hypothetical protein IM738_14075 [Hydrogenophaga sp. SL48]
MSEFNNRIATQREILLEVNSCVWQEELFGLSSGAIDRWTTINRLESESTLVESIRLAAKKLFFLSNKSQEQITEEYQHLADEVSALTKKIVGATAAHRKSD